MNLFIYMKFKIMILKREPEVLNISFDIIIEFIDQSMTYWAMTKPIFLEYIFIQVFSFFFIDMQQEITAESSRGGIDIKRIYGEWTTSYLLIRNANVGDGGQYVCAPAGGSQTSIKVHVFQNGMN